MLESAIRTAGVKNLRAEGWKVMVMHGSAFSGRGRADTVVCANGLYAEVEWKTTDGEPTPIQLHRLGETRRAGGIAFLCDSPDLVVAAIHYAMQGGELPARISSGWRPKR